MIASAADLLRLVALPVLGWAAYRDVRTRRVPNRTWIPLAVLAVLAFLLDARTALAVGNSAYFLRVAISLGFIVPLSYGFWRMGGFGGADAKAFMLLAALFPVYPQLSVGGLALPLEPSRLGVFSITILSNTVIVGLAYPLAVALGNVLRGHVAPAMFLGKPVRWNETAREYGRLLEDGDGFTRRGLDLDALRMYLRWRGTTLAQLRADPGHHRDPASLPDSPDHPGDGSLATDGGTPRADDPGPVDDEATTEPDPGPAKSAGDESTTGTARDESTTGQDPSASEGVETVGRGANPIDDPWGAATFLETIDHSAYGTSPEQLREGLDLLVEEEVVWLSPGIPFIVPTFFGLVLGLTYGDVLFVLMRVLGLA